MAPAERVAVVVVHGIADQRAGQTVCEVARLLCHGADGPPPYVQGELQEVFIPVEKLQPGSREDKEEGGRQKPGTPSGFYQAQPRAPQDLGIALHDYLLERLELPQNEALYQATRVQLRRRVDQRPVDLYEMYWADLSRLGSGGLRVLTSLYQLFFHLGTLAADVVDQVALSAKQAGPWRLLQRLHAWLAWLMKGPTALLQLGMLLVYGFGATALLKPELQGGVLAAGFALAALVLAGAAVVRALRGRRGGLLWLQLALLAAAALASLAGAIAVYREPHWIARLYFVAGVLGVAVLGAWLVERYAGITRGVRLLGHLVVGATAAALAAAGYLMLPQASTQVEWIVTAALRVGEVQLAAILSVWALFVVVQVAALLLGIALGRSCDPAARASLHTARLVFISSSGLFVVLSFLLWAAATTVAGRAVQEVLYTPLIFGSGYRGIEIFLDERAQEVGRFFRPLLIGYGALVVAALLVLLPSLLEEIKPTVNADAAGAKPGAAEWSRRLGGWLGAGIRALGTVFKGLVPAAAIAGSVFYLAFYASQFSFLPGAAGAVAERLLEVMDRFSGETPQTLKLVGQWLAGGALTIAALGARFKRTFGRLRVALDAILDVDNYFADPPDRQPPRARIFSRYASLLVYLRESGYGRIVIVAHSQGTVISADLLRYLHVQGRLQRLVGRVPLALVTVGSPLRDLYAERFPLLYRWVSPRGTPFEEARPAAADVGALEWVNACRSGDYVGRFIWTPDESPAVFDFGARRAGDRTELCLGAGAHTHYFDNDAMALAGEIDRLVAPRQPHNSRHEEDPAGVPRAAWQSDH